MVAKKAAKAKAKPGQVKKAGKAGKATKPTKAAKPAKATKAKAAKPAEKAPKVEEVEEEEAEEEQEVAAEGEAAAAKKPTKARRLEDALRAVEEDPDEDEGDEDEDETPVKKGKSGQPRGVIYLGHLPRGFFEPQLKKFFVQFGKVTRLRLSRSKKNAQSKGYCFIEFEDEAVAKIVADTMSKYLLFGKQLVCHVVPPEKVHPATFKGCRKHMVNFSHRRRRQAREAYNKRPKTEVDGESVPQTTERQVSRRNRSEKKLKAMLVSLGVDYDPSMAASSTAGAAGKPAQGKKRKAEEATEKKAVPEKAAPAKGPAGGKAAKAKAKKKSK